MFQSFLTFGDFLGANCFLASSLKLVLHCRWKGIEKFVLVHSLPVGPSGDFDYIQIDNEHYLIYANPKSSLSRQYKIITY